MRTITEYLINLFRSTRLYEMARSQQECEDRVSSQTKNILENLVLIIYFGISDFHTININHWKEELIISILNAADFRPKKDNSISRRARIVERTFKKDDMWDYDQIYSRIQKKFYDEKETCWPENKESQQYLDQAILGTISYMDDIVDLIVKYDLISIKEWVKKL